MTEAHADGMMDDVQRSVAAHSETRRAAADEIADLKARIAKLEGAKKASEEAAKVE